MQCFYNFTIKTRIKLESLIAVIFTVGSIEISVERTIDTGSNWATGYYGDMYRATVNMNYFAYFGWDFNGFVEEYNPTPDNRSLGCQIFTEDVPTYNVSCGRLNETHYTSVFTTNKTIWEEDSGSIGFYALENFASVEFRQAKTFSVQRECFFLEILIILIAIFLTVVDFYRIFNLSIIYRIIYEEKVVKDTCV